jgi:hypothetical protein
MSDDILDSVELEKDEAPTFLSYSETVEQISEHYFELLHSLLPKINNKELQDLLKSETENIRNKYSKNGYAILTFLTDNYLYCLEHIVDHNGDYFLYQTEKVKSKSGKIRKNKLSKIAGSILLKTLIEELDSKTINFIFLKIHEIFLKLTFQEENKISFHKEYIEFIHENFGENKNYNKIIMVLENTDEILNQEEEEPEEEAQVGEDPSDNSSTGTKKDKKKKKNKGGMFENMMNPDFIKNLENTKIAQLAKNISEKIKIEDFPMLSDPSKLFESFTGGNPENGNDFQNLMKTVIQEVQTSFQDNKLNETDLIQEAKGIMNNMGGLNPMDLFGKKEDGKDGLNMGMFEQMFSHISK